MDRTACTEPQCLYKGDHIPELRVGVLTKFGVKSKTFYYITNNGSAVHINKFISWIIFSGVLELVHTGFSETHFK
jgi:hypothetical protein